MVVKIDSDEVIQSLIDYNFQKKPIVLYGAGNYGTLMYKYLLKKFNIEANAFAVSEGQDKEGNIKTKPVLYLNEVDRNSVLIICVAEQKQNTLFKMAKSYGFLNVYVVLNEFVRYIQTELSGNKLLPLQKISFEVHITEHCNLNCKGCYHFSPLADPEFLQTKEFRNDIKRIFDLCGSNVFRITLLGGEPLLHPDLVDFFKIVREHWPDCHLDLLTNGILLPQMNKLFWHACVQYDVQICCTKYPINIDYSGIEDVAKRFGLSIIYHNDVGAGEKMLIKYPFDLSGSQDIKWNYEHCTRSNFCITLKHGKLYTCPMAAHMHLAKDYFKLDIELSSYDSINIYDADCMDDITNFLVKPIPFCRYCNLGRRPEQMKWESSQKQIEEWF